MKVATSLLAAVLLVGALGTINTAIGADGIIYKQELTPGSYCHLKGVPRNRRGHVRHRASGSQRSRLRRHHRFLWAV